MGLLHHQYHDSYWLVWKSCWHNSYNIIASYSATDVTTLQPLFYSTGTQRVGPLQQLKLSDLKLDCPVATPNRFTPDADSGDPTTGVASSNPSTTGEENESNINSPESSPGPSPRKTQTVSIATLAGSNVISTTAGASYVVIGSQTATLGGSAVTMAGQVVQLQYSTSPYCLKFSRWIPLNVHYPYSSAVSLQRWAAGSCVSRTDNFGASDRVFRSYYRKSDA